MTTQNPDLEFLTDLAIACVLSNMTPPLAIQNVTPKHMECLTKWAKNPEASYSIDEHGDLDAFLNPFAYAREYLTLNIKETARWQEQEEFDDFNDYVVEQGGECDWKYMDDLDLISGNHTYGYTDLDMFGNTVALAPVNYPMRVNGYEAIAIFDAYDSISGRGSDALQYPGHTLYCECVDRNNDMIGWRYSVGTGNWDSYEMTSDSFIDFFKRCTITADRQLLCPICGTVVKAEAGR